MQTWLERRFSSLGKTTTLKPLIPDFAVSNDLQIWDTSEGRFVVKSMIAPKALYGHADVQARLEAVALATRQMRAAGLPVEHTVKADDGHCVQKETNRLIRVYEWIEGRNHQAGTEDSLLAARALHRLHDEGLGCLSESLFEALTPFGTAYPLCETGPKLASVSDALSKRAPESKYLTEILDQWKDVEWAVNYSLKRGLPSDIPPCLVHTDFHPRNVIFSEAKGLATLIDLDNCIVDHPYKCLGFSILRFAFPSPEEVTITRLEKELSYWAQGRTENEPTLRDDIHTAMVWLEAEKVVRILYRWLQTDSYFEMVPNILKLHLPNLIVLRGLLQGDYQ